MMEHLHKLYPGIMPHTSLSNMKGTTLDKRLAYFCKALISVRDSWTKNHEWMNYKLVFDKNLNVENTIVEQLVDTVFATLDCMIKAARELFDMMDEEDMKEGYSTQAKTFKSVSNEASCPLELNNQNSSPLNQKNGKVEELKPNAKEEKSNSEVTVAELKPGNPTKPSMSMLPSKGSVQSVPPPMMPSKGPAPSPPTPMPLQKRPAPPPPPPLGATKSLHRKSATTKLKRSVKMINLFRNLKRNVEGSSLVVNSADVVSERGAPAGTRTQIGGATGWKQGLAASLAELTKRSSYFQQIEEDARKHERSIMELKIAIRSFQAKDMVKLLKFQRSVESFLEGLTDETQVLAKYEDFPTKKLEALRTAAALYSKLDTIATNLKELQIVAPLDQLFNKVESYFSKIKKELEALERIKEEESKKFKSHDIHFDFNILTLIKELMVDVSSSCMELALKREAKAAKANEEIGSKADRQRKGNSKMLWRAFQLAYRVYAFAGGQDDRADKLAEEVAHEITAHS
ncbi:uncharacterized protein At4g04980-like isoform X2 [Alnus glutinosa]|uniref:uncharacterized protein At4g04980-like isoform X2 n=1 Tax=Alnus glutinosa TaxID=3517 RepID=UPI002D792E84|nr:uncharacterized protein At4g04980-like isoform X2 [Alnus glutinosa]